MSKKPRLNKAVSLIFAFALVFSALLGGVNATAADLTYQDLLISPGSDESRLMFTWYTSQATGTLAIWAQGDENTYTEVAAATQRAADSTSIRQRLKVCFQRLLTITCWLAKAIPLPTF